jgi:hypothetical protein
MTKAKTDPKTRLLDVDRTFLNVTQRWRAGEDSPEKRTGLYSAASILAHVVFRRYWRPAQLFLCAQQLVTLTEEEHQREAVASALSVLEAGIPEMSEELDLRALAAGITCILRDVGFTTPEIAALVDDGRGGNTEQRQDRVRLRYKADAAEKLQQFWSTASVKWNSGA